MKKITITSLKFPSDWRFVFTLFFIFLYSFKFQPNETKELKNSLLWKIEGNGLSKTSYLFGSMHLIEKEYFYFPQSLEKIVKKTSLLVMEIDEIPNQSKVLSYLKIKNGSLFDYFSTTQSDSILNWAKETLFMDEATFKSSFSNFKPFFIIQLATQIQFLGRTESYEMAFQNLAKKYKMETKGLETIEEQVRFFDDLTNESQAEMVMESIRNKNKMEELKRMQQMYQRQEIDSLYFMIHSEMKNLEKEIFIDQRNQKWIPKIKSFIEHEPTFIVVGAGHLSGEKGLLQLLKNEGYTVNPVKF
jgi:uncharacterized protein